METTSPVTPTEKTQLDGLVKSFAEFRTAQYDFNSRTDKALGKISRGLYGDEDNDQEGVIDRLADQDKRLDNIHGRVKKVEGTQYKIGVWLAVGSALAIGIFEYIKSIWK